MFTYTIATAHYSISTLATFYELGRLLTLKVKLTVIVNS
ncbi:Uncharacterised protein [Zhongshania aliphaticivorans]|uniref:Uncharacterized protein n=1 Tax=Zhongshania aliphaticivorans TaxID=1470434 RepID=A0A5S9NQ32_9GAMM|nr:Uncharacterised protein [Zhongshania aliphaticivorans]CAA0109724.1 Uncharacterised protein [Zhongshania aliphaticivorans]